MVTTLTLPRLLAGGRGSLWRIAAVTGRDLTAVRHSGYWLVVLSGFFEPVLYLLAIGVGVGGLVGGFELPDGSTVSYAAFVAPAMLAASAMNGAMTEATFNFFAKMKWVRLYDAMVATPLRPFEIAIGELGWALIRGSLYSVAFLGIMVALDLTTIGWAVLALPASVLVGFAFGGLGMAISTLIRSWVDFDYVNVVQFGMFLFSGDVRARSSPTRSRCGSWSRCCRCTRAWSWSATSPPAAWSGRPWGTSPIWRRWPPSAWGSPPAASTRSSARSRPPVLIKADAGD